MSKETRGEKTSREFVEDMLFGKKKPKIHRHRCLDCGKVTKHVFCPECTKKRRVSKGLY